jgi:hypothetical protein
VSNERDSTRPDPRPAGLGMAVAGQLRGTVLWAVRFAVACLLVPTACLVGDWLLHVVGLVTILAALVVVLVNLRWARQPWATPARFLLAVGLALNVFFLAVTVLASSAVLFVDACAKGAIP